MSANAAVATAVVSTVTNAERGHKIRLVTGYVIAIALTVAIVIYGFNYYTLSVADRPFSPKHAMLRPSGAVGLKLGFLGLGMFLVIFLYPLRKRWAWLGRQGSARHWLDFHVLLGLWAPFVIALHSSFKFRGFAGIAFWIMLAVSLSGVIGRYLYAQIPRSLHAAEISRKELQERQEALLLQLKQQKVLPETGLNLLLKLPPADRVAEQSMLVALVSMMAIDVMRPFRIAKLRRHALGWGETFSTVGGFLRTRHRELEQAIELAREEAASAKRVLFLDRAEQVFHLWHVVHKPFSYSFALLALIHIGVVIAMGYF
jgi:hypothetical protein